MEISSLCWNEIGVSLIMLLFFILIGLLLLLFFKKPLKLNIL